MNTLFSKSMYLTFHTSKKIVTSQVHSLKIVCSNDIASQWVDNHTVPLTMVPSVTQRDNRQLFRLMFIHYKLFCLMFIHLFVLLVLLNEKVVVLHICACKLEPEKYPSITRGFVAVVADRIHLKLN